MRPIKSTASALPFGLAGGLNSGIERVDGVEMEFTKGDFDKNGLSFLDLVHLHERRGALGQLSRNDDQSDRSVQSRHRELQRPHQGRRRFAMLREQQHGNVLPDPNCAQLKPDYNPPILNPYYAMSPQPLLDRNGWYPGRTRLRLSFAERAQRDRQLQAQQISRSRPR